MADKQPKEHITLKLTREEAARRAEELRTHENVQLFLRVQDGQKKLEELQVLAQELQEE